MKRIFSAVLCAVVISNCALAQTAPAEKKAETGEFLSLDLKSLMDVEVSVASKKPEKASAAPSIVNVITADDIRRYGANNLRDIFDRETSIQTYGSSYVPENIVSIRGQTLQHENNHALFLIDGRPFRDSNSGGFITSLLASMPIDVIDHIEIIRGPGSVIYGSNAFSGVINMVTRTADKLKNANITASYGSFNTRALDASGAVQGKDWSIVAAHHSLGSAGWNYDVTDGTGASDNFGVDYSDSGTLLAAHYKNLTVDAFYGTKKQLALSPCATLPPVAFSTESFFVNTGYRQDLSKDWFIKFDNTLNTFHLGNGTGRSDDVLNEISLQGKWFETLGFLCGSTYENHHGWITGRYVSAQWFSAFSQLDYEPFQRLKLVGGLQMNDPGNQPRSFSPRFAAIVNFNEHWGAKLLYGQAFRTANTIETSVDVPGIITGNPDLTPEEIATQETQIFYRTPKFSASLTYYSSEMRHIIARLGFPIEFANAGTVNFHGLELESKAVLTDRLSLTGNASYQRNRNQLGQYDATFTPNLMAKLGIAYDSAKGYTLGLYDSYFGNPAQIREFTTVVEFNPKPKSYHLVTFNASLDLGRFLDAGMPARMTLSIFADNLLDEDIRFPDINNQSINSIPIRSRRALFGRIAAKF